MTDQRQVIWVKNALDRLAPAMPYPVSPGELARIVEELAPVHDEADDGMCQCTPLAAEITIGEAAGGRLLTIRRCPCGMDDSCGVEGWIPGTPAVPPPGWHHSYDIDADECQCGNIHADYQLFGID